MAADVRPVGLTYEPFYGLREKPFSLTSDSRFFYPSRSHAPAFDDLLNAIRRRESLNVLTGDIGTGKTTLCRTVLQGLDRKTFSAFVPDPFASREELLKVLLTDFGVASVEDVGSGRLRHATRTELSYLLHEFLGTLAPLQAFAVVVIDEAQNLSQQLLEEVRILSDADGQLQVVLVGQLELRDRLKQPDMRQLEQRVSVHCQLQPLDLPGVAGYISHRLHVAGGSSDRVRFTGEGVEAVYLLSGGVPRLINRLCDRALRFGHSKHEATIDADIVQEANPETLPGELDVLVTAPAVPLVAAPVTPPIAQAPVVQPPAAQAPAPAAQPSVAQPSVPAPAVPPAPAAAIPAAPAPAQASRPSPVVPEASPSPRQAPPALPDHLEEWLTQIETQPEAEPVSEDWRHRWRPVSVAPAPLSERRSGVRLRIPQVANPRPYSRIERMRRRWTRKFFGACLGLSLLLGAMVLGPATIAASLDIWSQIDEQFTPPADPEPPPRPHVTGGGQPRVQPAADESDDDR